jgi:glycosyltransferase involved in cell wall biosynthesis
MGGIPGLVEHGRSGLLCEANSSEALAATLQQLIDQPALLAELRQGLPSVKSIEQDARDWEETYQRLVRRRTSSAPTRHALES